MSAFLNRTTNARRSIEVIGILGVGTLGVLQQPLNTGMLGPVSPNIPVTSILLRGGTRVPFFFLTTYKQHASETPQSKEVSQPKEVTPLQVEPSFRRAPQVPWFTTKKFHIERIYIER